MQDETYKRVLRHIEFCVNTGAYEEARNMHREYKILEPAAARELAERYPILNQ